MVIGQALVLGTIQGLTEFLPISSSGHLIFVPALFGWADQGLAFDVVVHLGTLVAVVAYFRKRLWLLIRSVICDTNDANGSANVLNYANVCDRRTVWYIFLSIIPVGIVGFFFGDWIEAHTRSAAVVAWSLIGWGVVLGVADRLALKHQNIKTLKQITWKDTIFISCAQAIALIPGTSRSGITMTAGLFSRLDRKNAVEFSFLMSIPAIALAGGYKLIQLINSNLTIYQFNSLSIGFAASALSGFIAIWGLMKIIQKWSFLPFVIYRIAVGVLILAALT